MEARLSKVWKLLLRHYSVMACIKDFGSCKSTSCESTEYKSNNRAASAELDAATGGSFPRSQIII